MVMTWFSLSSRPCAAILATVALWGCATAPATPELAVRQRAALVWQAKVAGDYDKAYTFMPPSYRTVTSVAAYRKTFGGAVKMVASEVTSVRCESEDKCIATMKLEARAALARGSSAPITTHFDEVWVREAGDWWLFPTS